MSTPRGRLDGALSADVARANVHDPSTGRRTPRSATQPVPHGAGSASTVAQLLGLARAAGLARLDAQVLLAHHLSRERVWVIANEDFVVPGSAIEQFRADVNRRAGAVPLAYLTGAKEFHGLKLRVTPDVLIPRPETEALVDWALELLGKSSAATIIDLGTGSGAIALALKSRSPGTRVLGTDASAAALDVARSNARALDLDVQFVHGDWWDAAGDQRFELALSNPPYVAANDPHLEALLHEPAAALVAGADGLDALRAIIAGAPAHLRPGAWLVLEHGNSQAEAVAALARSAGFSEIALRRDLTGHPRCTAARRPRG